MQVCCRGEANGPNLIIWQVLSTVNRMEMEFGGFIYLAGPPHNTTVLLGKWKYGETENVFQTKFLKSFSLNRRQSL